MEILIKVLQLILSLSLLVFVHELGHYLTARMFGIRVEKFYLFFDAGGFSIFKFKIGETTFGLGWVPFGGYCKISGMIDESMDTEAMKQPPQPWEFRSKPAWQRLIVMVSGVVMNVITACLIYIGMSLHWGDSYIDNDDLKWGYSYNELAREIGFENGDRIVSFDGKPVEGDFRMVYSDMVIGGVRTVGVLRGSKQMTVSIPEDKIARMLESRDFMLPRHQFVAADIVPGSGAAEAGMMPGDSLVAVNGTSMIFFDEFGSILSEIPGTTAAITVMRDSVGVMVSRILNVAVSPEGKIGVVPKNYTYFIPARTRDYNFVQAVPAGFRKAGEQISSYWQQLKLIFTPKTEAYKSVGSLISIGSIFPGQWDWFSFWRITAFISIALAVINILPIPALDGGHVFFLLWEVVTRRKPSDKFMEVMQVIGLVILLALLILTFGNDIYRFFIK
jgi:regulator of sigma E protease